MMKHWEVPKHVEGVCDDLAELERALLGPNPPTIDQIRTKIALARKNLRPIYCEHPEHMIVAKGSSDKTITMECGDCGSEGELEYDRSCIEWQ